MAIKKCTASKFSRVACEDLYYPGKPPCKGCPAYQEEEELVQFITHEGLGRALQRAMKKINWPK